MPVLRSEKQVLRKRSERFLSGEIKAVRAKGKEAGSYGQGEPSSPVRGDRGEAQLGGNIQAWLPPASVIAVSCLGNGGTPAHPWGAVSQRDAQPPMLLSLCDKWFGASENL